MDEQIVGLRWQQRFRRRKVERRYAAIGGFALCSVLSGCQGNSGPSSAELIPVAQFFADHGGLSLDQNPKRPCLQGIDLDNTVVGGLFGGTSVTLVNFIEQQGLATMTRTPDGTGRTEVVMTPTDAYKANWVSSATDSSYRYFCFGKFLVTKVEPVPDAKPTTAGSNEPYLIPGTAAYSTRVTYKWDGVSPKLVAALKETPHVLIRGSMLPDEYGVEKTVVALLPDKTENIQLNP